MPLTAVGGRDSKGSFVWIVAQGSGTVHRREVVLGDLATGGVQIAAGLTPGELVVAAGVEFLEEGQRVRLTP